MRNLLPGDLVDSRARIIRHSIISAALFCSGLVVVGLAQLGRTPTSSTTHPPDTTLAPAAFEALQGMVKPKTVTVTRTHPDHR